jgi:hypothetical protein
MSWETYRVIAAQYPARAGAVISMPIVRDPEGRAFLVRDVSDAAPQPNSLVDEDALDRGDVGAFRRVPERPAEREHLVVVISPEFVEAVEWSCSWTWDGWEHLPDKYRMLYGSVQQIAMWRASSAESMINHARRMVRQRHALENTPRDELLKRAEAILRQVRYITNGNSRDRLQMYIVLGSVISELDPRRWNALADLASRETGLEPEQLAAAIRAVERPDPAISESSFWGGPSGSPSRHVFGDAVERSLRPAGSISVTR